MLAQSWKNRLLVSEVPTARRSWPLGSVEAGAGRAHLGIGQEKTRPTRSLRRGLSLESEHLLERAKRPFVCNSATAKVKIELAGK